MIRVHNVQSTYLPEPLASPFGFKGGYVSELWQSIARLEEDQGNEGLGLGTQSVLWSDPRIFAAHSESTANELMYATTAYALAQIGSFETPLDLFDSLFEPVRMHAERITERPDLRTTFVLNALVPIDFAAWVLYARTNGFRSFDDMIPEAYRSGLPARQAQVAAIPTIGFGLSVPSIRTIAESGCAVVKVKLGHPGLAAEMLERDKERMTTSTRSL